MKDHNPQNLNPEFIDIHLGFRFLTTEEVELITKDKGGALMLLDALAPQFYHHGVCRWADHFGNFVVSRTYRTQAPRSLFDDLFRMAEAQQPPFVPIEFEGVNIRIAEDQPQYITLPGNLHHEQVEPDIPPVPAITFCWKLSPEALAEINRTGVIWHTVLTFGDSLQPTRLEVTKPDFGT